MSKTENVKGRGPGHSESLVRHAPSAAHSITPAENDTPVGETQIPESWSSPGISLVLKSPQFFAEEADSAKRQAASLQQLLDFPDWTPTEVENRDLRQLILDLRTRGTLAYREALKEKSLLASYYRIDELLELEALANESSLPIHEMQGAIVREYLANIREGRRGNTT